jgi:hypothetical protein
MLRLRLVILASGWRIIFSGGSGSPLKMPQFWKGEYSNGFRVRCADAREADLVFVDERPFAVLEWAETGAAMVTIELDPAKLRASGTGGDVYIYLGALKDPR